jgi:hypothetical protein
MNCKLGDMAMVINTAFNDGKVVKCLEYIGHHQGDRPQRYGGKYKRDVWLTDTQFTVVGFETGETKPSDCYMSDSNLMPIRPEPDPLEITEEVEEEITE